MTRLVLVIFLKIKKFGGILVFSEEPVVWLIVHDLLYFYY